MKDAGSVFPVYDNDERKGMSVRDWFAGQALPGLIALDSDADYKGIVHDAYLFADAMLAERDKEA
jgi:hypothetical protein